MTAGTAKEPGALSYELFLSDDNSSWRLLETYVNSVAPEAHLPGLPVRELVPHLRQSTALRSTGIRIRNRLRPCHRSMRGSRGSGMDSVPPARSAVEPRDDYGSP